MNIYHLPLYYKELSHPACSFNFDLCAHECYTQHGFVDSSFIGKKTITIICSDVQITSV